MKGGNKMASSKIDLSGHKNPEGFLEEMRTKYPDRKVNLSLDGNNLLVDINENVHTQIQINILSFLSEKAKEQIWAN